MNYQRGEIILVPFPFIDLSRQKTRPAEVVSSQAYNTRMDDLILTAISSQISTVDPLFDLLLPATHPRFAATGLRVSSLIKAGKIVTIEQLLIYRKLGSLSIDLMAQLENCLRRTLDLGTI